MNNTTKADSAHYLVSSRGNILAIDKSQLHDYLENNNGFDPWVFDTSSASLAEEKAEENKASVEACENPTH